MKLTNRLTGLHNRSDNTSLLIETIALVIFIRIVTLDKKTELK